MLDVASLISSELSLESRLIAGDDRCFKVFLHAPAAAVEIGGGGSPQVIQTLALPEDWRQKILDSLNVVNSIANVDFELVEDSDEAEIAFYVDTEISLGDHDNGTTLGITLTNFDHESSRRWFEIILNGPEMLRQTEGYVAYIINHELGHALGLEHPFDDDDGDYYLSTDSQFSATPEQTVMSYRNPVNGQWPQDYSAVDQSALVQIWGASLLLPTFDMAGNTLVYRLYDPVSNLHVFSANSKEIDLLTGQGGHGFLNEGVAYTPGADAPQGLYRFYQESTGRHLYSANDYERDLLMADLSSSYLYEGVAFNVFANDSPPDTGTAVMRFYDSLSGSHYYSANAEEQSIWTDAQPTWINEGVAWFA